MIEGNTDLGELVTFVVPAVPLFAVPLLLLFVPLKFGGNGKGGLGFGDTEPLLLGVTFDWFPLPLLLLGCGCIVTFWPGAGITFTGGILPPPLLWLVVPPVTLPELELFWFWHEHVLFFAGVVLGGSITVTLPFVTVIV